ncbi:hypothetical protein N8449_05310 [Alphaproteobacteria bacterium]|nr:hypothetical protein [Alphaproteobacteria bacterium]
MFKKLFFIIVTVVFSFFIPLAIFEFYLSQNNKYPDYKSYTYDINNIRYSSNDNPDKYFDNDHVKKIIFLGDSFTQGQVCAGEKKDFVNLLKQHYKKKSDLEIFNFGVIGTGPLSYLHIYNYFQTYGKNLKKITVVLNYNDIALNIYDFKTLGVLNRLEVYSKRIELCDKKIKTKSDRYTGTLIKTIDNFLEKTLTWMFIRNKLYNIFPSLRKYYGYSIFEKLYMDKQSVEFITYIDLLKKLKNKAKNDGVDINFIYFPDVNYLKDDNPKFWKTINQEAEKVGIKIHDSWEYFMEHKDTTDMRWSHIDYHPNCNAHKIMANYFIKYNLVEE